MCAQTQTAPKPSLAVWKFSSCDGCQLSILDCEDELLALAGAIDIANFPEASRAVYPGPYDVSLVEGSVTTPEDRERLQDIRKQSKYLIAIGACAVSGGIQALKNLKDVDEFISIVYANPEYISTLETSTSIAEHIPVDLELRGCPINKAQLIAVLTAVLHGKQPHLSPHSVCIECKLNGNPCLTVAHGTPCLGPVTHAGCDALCPSFNRGCFGCYGPKESANSDSIVQLWQQMGVPDAQIERTINHIHPVDGRNSGQHNR